MKQRYTETDLKALIKEYLDLRGIFHFPLTQGLGSYRGLPDRVMHYEGRVHYLEIKKPNGVLSAYQQAFQEQCQGDGISYHVIKSLADLAEILGDLSIYVDSKS